MNFIEKYFGISPDGGDSSLEIMVLVLLYDLCRHRNALALLAEEPKKRRSKAKERLLTHGAADSEEHLG